MVNSVESDKSKGFNIGEVVKQTGLSAHTLRYYEKEGLLPFVTKNSSGIRVYTTTDLRWLSMIECLKDSGLQIKETLYTKAIELGSLKAADNDKNIMRLKKKLFDSPDDFDKRIQEAG